MNIIVAPDSFKGSLKANKVADHIKKGLLKAIPDASISMYPLADGGEGTVEALVTATNGNLIQTTVKDPLDREINSYFGILGDGKTAVIETAAASGLALLDDYERNPLLASSKGTGQLIKEALDHNCDHIILGLGGSATNDAGAGILQALGLRLLDNNGYDLHPGAADLLNFAEIDDENFDKRILESSITIASDVTNPLSGENGASKIYGPQKGADPKMTEILDQNLSHFGNTLERLTKKSIKNIPGTGAAGGIAASLLAFTPATIKPGAETIMNYTGIKKNLNDKNLLITGEGQLDNQTLNGKAPLWIAQEASQNNLPVIGIAGSLGEGYQNLYEKGFNAIFSIIDRPAELKEIIKITSHLIENLAENIGRIIKINY